MVKTVNLDYPEGPYALHLPIPGNIDAVENKKTFQTSEITKSMIHDRAREENYTELVSTLGV